jgi:hypothetical protein
VIRWKRLSGVLGPEISGNSGGRGGRRRPNIGAHSARATRNNFKQNPRRGGHAESTNDLKHNVKQCPQCPTAPYVTTGSSLVQQHVPRVPALLKRMSTDASCNRCALVQERIHNTHNIRRLLITMQAEHCVARCPRNCDEYLHS